MTSETILSLKTRLSKFQSGIFNTTKKLINWRGEINNNHLSITEDDTDEENIKNWIPKATVEADIKGNKIVGTWQDFITKKYLNLELEEL